jgi:hemerythrin-like domain-containing protein
MSNPIPHHFSTSFYNIHAIITRGLQVSREAVQAAAQHGLWDDKQKEGLLNYLRAFSAVLNSHHLTEDELIFPYFRDKLPGAPFDVLVRWHEEMVEMLNEINQAVEKCDRNEQLGTNLARLEDSLTRLDESWQPHIQMEDEELITKADMLVPDEQEQLTLVRQAGEHSSKIALPAPLTVPFLLYNLPPDDRKVFSQTMPPEVVQTLVPVVWKEQWESMKPFLLS